MKRYDLQFAFFLCAAICTLSTSRAQTNTLFVPKELETKFDNSWAEPFSSQVTRFQQIYSQSEFAELTTDTIVITKLAFRLDDSNTTGIDMVVPGVLLRMNVFQGSLGEIVESKSGLQNPLITIFQAQDVHLVGRAGQIDAFDIEFEFKKPFVYDRRLGQLVLHFGGTFLLTLDASGVDPLRGFYLYSEAFPEGQIRFQSHIIATKFTYELPPVIQQIRNVNNTVHIDFMYSGGLMNIHFEISTTVNGSYTPIENVEMIPQSPGVARAIIPVSSQNRFYRIRQEPP